VATAHVAALERFDDVVGSTQAVLNIGTGAGTTVRELITAVGAVTGSPVAAADAPARPGDTAGAYTRTERARRLLGWEPQFSVEDGIRDSLRWAAVRDEKLA
jgi:UDP-glucose 4-epimerase